MQAMYSALSTPLILVALAWALAATGDAPDALPVDAATALANRAAFQMMTATSAIPPAVLACCADDDHRLAEPGARWAPNDALTGAAALPRHRLLWMAQGGEYTVVHFEQGGFVPTFHVVVLRGDALGSDAAVLLRRSGPRLADYAQFVQALQRNAFTDEL